jgi:hypothetical protein
LVQKAVGVVGGLEMDQGGEREGEGVIRGRAERLDVMNRCKTVQHISHPLTLSTLSNRRQAGTFHLLVFSVGELRSYSLCFRDS